MNFDKYSTYYLIISRVTISRVRERKMSENLRRKRDEDDIVVTLDDVLEFNAHVEETASAVLGGSDDTNCSYDKVKCAAYVCCVLVVAATILY